MIDFYEDHASERDKFEVLAIHDDEVKSFRELDKKLIDVKKKYWAGKSLPCPILIDGRKKTHELYGVHGWPTGVLIDPEGKVVGESSLSFLATKLAPLSAAKHWARHRDSQKNVFWTFEPKDYTFDAFARVLGRWTETPIEIDAAAIQAAGFTTNSAVPGMICGSSITLRSIDELLLAPHGLGIVPGDGGKSLRLTRRAPAKEPASYLQKSHNAELKKRLDGDAATGGDTPLKPLTIDNQSLLEALKLIGHEYNLPVGLEAKAMQLGQIKPDAKVSGTIEPAKLRKSLTKFLEPLGLKLEVRQEIVLVVPAKQ